MNNMQGKYNRTPSLIKPTLMRKKTKAKLERVFYKMKKTMKLTNLGDFYKDRSPISD
jgi:hypothetical protein